MTKYHCVDLNCNHGESPAAFRQQAQPVDASRRTFLDGMLTAVGGLAGLSLMGGCAQLARPSGVADTVILNGRIATLNPKQPFVSAIAIQGGNVLALGTDSEMQAHKGPQTRVIDVAGRTVIPGLNDSHCHFIRAALTYSMELGWDGVPSLSDALGLLRDQARRTPPPFWVQVLGGWSWNQFAEKRFPTVDEINSATGDTPAMVMHLWDRAWLNQAAMRVLGWTKDTPNMFGGVIERDKAGNPTGVVVSTTSLGSLAALIGRLPKLSAEEQELSTRHYMRQHNRVGITSVVDAGGGGQNFPDNYASISSLAQKEQVTVRIGYNLFPQTPGKEYENFVNWSTMVKPGDGNDYLRMIGAGEYLVWSAGDPANFSKPFSGFAPVMESQLIKVAKYVAGRGWPFRLHCSYDASAQRILNVLEQVHREVPLNNLRWGLDHCEGLSPKSLERVAVMGGSIAIQGRMILDGEAYLTAQGAEAAAEAPPIARIRQMGIPLACGTDANRITSFNPWVTLQWLVTGKTAAGTKLQADRNLLDRTEALRIYSSGGAWMTREDHRKGSLEPGKFADLVVLSQDYFSVPEDKIKATESVMTMVGGKVVYAAGSFVSLGPETLPVIPDWLPIQSPSKSRAMSGVPVSMTAVTHSHPLIIGERGTWSLDCACAA